MHIMIPVHTFLYQSDFRVENELGIFTVRVGSSNTNHDIISSK